MENTKNTIKILLVDDHKLFLDGLRLVLRKAENLIIKGEAHNGIEALEFLKKNEIDLIITDVNMPEMSGTELTKKVKELYPEIKVLVLTQSDEKSVINEIIQSEAEGYLLKKIDKEELIFAINKIINNGSYYCNEMAEIMMQNLKSKKHNIIHEELTERETEILKLICMELSTIEIAKKLFISDRTVDSHRSNILKKIKAKTVIGLVKYAIENDIYKVG